MPNVAPTTTLSAAALLLVAGQLLAQASVSPPCETLTGEVDAGQAYERTFGPDLVFGLAPAVQAPPNPAGWRLEVRDARDGEHDFVWVATPPYRFENPRDLTTSYGRRAREVVAWSPRTFRFATRQAQYEAFARAVDFLLWRPPEISSAEYEAGYDSVRTRWETLLEETGRGELHITDAELAKPEPEAPLGRIRRLAFRVRLCPAGREPAPTGAADTDVGNRVRQEAPDDPGRQERPPNPPGRTLEGAAPLPVARLAESCLALGWSEERGAPSDSLVAAECRVAETGTLQRTGDTEWRYALYRRQRVHAPDASTPEDRLGLFPDTLRERELVLFAGRADEALTTAVWQDRVDAELALPRPPRAVLAAELPSGREAEAAEDPEPAAGALFFHRRCLAGTGGCRDHAYRLTADGRVEPLHPEYLRTLEAGLPAEWGTWKGVWLETTGPAAIAPVYLPGNANCCPAFEAHLPLRLEGDSLVAEGLHLRPDTAHRDWRVRAAEGRFGPVDGETSEAELRRRVGDSQVEPEDVHLGEGFCTVGARVFPGTPWELEVAWSDSTRRRPAFARLQRDSTPFRTPAGVTVGTPLHRLEEIAGGPIRFQGFGWDYGGRTGWTAEGGELVLVLRYDAERLEAVVRSLDDPDRDLDPLFGDRLVTSAHPLTNRLGIRVRELLLGWRRAEVQRECERPPG